MGVNISEMLGGAELFETYQVWKRFEVQHRYWHYIGGNEVKNGMYSGLGKVHQTNRSLSSLTPSDKTIRQIREYKGPVTLL